jgi:hypothetical protein
MYNNHVVVFVAVNIKQLHFLTTKLLLSRSKICNKKIL